MADPPAPTTQVQGRVQSRVTSFFKPINTEEQAQQAARQKAASDAQTERIRLEAAEKAAAKALVARKPGRPRSVARGSRLQPGRRGAGHWARRTSPSSLQFSPNNISGPLI